MSSSQAPINFYMHNAAPFQAPPTMESSAGVPMHATPLDMEHFLMDHTHHARMPSPGAATQHAQLDAAGGHPQFADFSFRYHHGSLSVGDIKLENVADPYRLSRQGPASDHRASITSMPGNPRASFSSGMAIAHGHASLDGSEGASPTSNRNGGYGDDFGLASGGVLDGSDLGSRAKEERSDPIPPWSELKTKAGKERKRLPLACIACRRKKIRCSGEKPACKHCLRSKVPCVYKVTARKAAPRTDYMAMLDKRLKRMEERIIKIVPKEEQDATVSIVRAAVKPAMPGTVSVRSSTNKKRAADEAFGAELECWSKSPSNSHVDSSSLPSLTTQDTTEQELLSEGAAALPPRDIQEHLAEVFFENVYGQTYYLLHEPSFMRRLKAGAVPPVLILAICAISARFSTHPKLTTNPAFLRGESWAAEARSIVMRRYESPNITILTSLILLGLHEFGTCQGNRSWALGGQAIQMAYALQLHKDLEYDPSKRDGKVAFSFVDREIRRRTMWACFLMDRFNSSGTERPNFIKEIDMKIPLPVKEELFRMGIPGPTENLKGKVNHPVPAGSGELSDAKQNMGIAAYTIRAISLWGRVINYLNLGGREEDAFPVWHSDSRFAELLRQSDNFESSLPDFLKYSAENLRAHETECSANQFLFLHISIQQVSLFLNRFALPGAPARRGSETASAEFVKRAGTKSFDAANRISALLKDCEAHCVTAPFTGYCAFLASTVHIFGMFSKNTQMEAASRQNLAINVKYLSKMKKYWGMFHFMSKDLKAIYRSCADASLKGAAGACEVPSKSVFQFGDWFDQHPHGVSQSDFEDATVGIKKESGEDAALEQKSDHHTMEDFFHSVSPTHAHNDAPKAQRRKVKKPAMMRPGILDPIDTNVQNIPLEHQMQGGGHPGPHGYNQISPTSPVNVYQQPPYYGDGALLSPHAQSMLPHLDRPLVYGAYTGMEPAGLSAPGMLEGGGGSATGGGEWTMPMGGVSSGYMSEPSTAWYMPFNMEAPEIRHEAAMFAGLGGGARSGYASMPINNPGMGGRN